MSKKFEDFFNERQKQLKSMEGSICISEEEIKGILEELNELAQYQKIGTIEDIEKMQKELERWHTSEINSRIRNVFANVSTVCCMNCDHKDEYIEELEAEAIDRQSLIESILCRLETIRQNNIEKVYPSYENMTEFEIRAAEQEKAISEIKKVAEEGNGWISVKKRLPDDLVNPITRDAYVYPVTVDLGGVYDTRYYSFCRGHWYNGSSKEVDELVIAWKERLMPYNPKEK